MLHTTEAQNVDANTQWQSHKHDYLSKIEAVLSKPSGTAVDNYDQLIKLLRSLHKKRCDFRLPFAVNIQVSLGLLQAIWHKCAIKFDKALKDGDLLLAFSSLADVFYLSTIWFDNRTKEVDGVNYVKQPSSLGSLRLSWRWGMRS